jgi:hypothetical protein
MSRSKRIDDSTAVSLFPFLAVLLCTMGALLVVLVAVSRAAREAALRDAAAHRQVTAGKADRGLHRELARIEQHTATINQVRSQAEQQLREQQLRLGQLENHMRRLQDRLAVLQASAAELVAIEEEHYDDREQAQREIERLERLIAETREAVDALKKNSKPGNHAYALIPYEGPNGTFRRPIYIECRENELILQPEGVPVTRDDLYPPYGAGNPLAAALRAARDYHVQLHPTEGKNRDTDPYPLLVVRPAGLLMYDRARRAIQNSDFDFGFELVEDDWELKFPVADPKLAGIEQQAIDQARIRQRALAAAAPRAYRHGDLALLGPLELEDDGGIEGFGFSDVEGDAGPAGDDAGATPGGSPSGSPIVPTNGAVGGPAQLRTLRADANVQAPATGADDGEKSPGAQAIDSGSRSAGGQNEASMAASAADSAGPAGEAGGAGTSMPGMNNHVVVSTPSGADEPAEARQCENTAQPRGRDWALRKKPNAVPIRRTIQVLVRGDEIAIIPDDRTLDAATPSGKRIPVEGDTVESLDDVVAAVQEHIEDWGMAGDGLYWRPVLILNISGDGQRRAEDLNRLLKGSGIELRMAKILNNPPGTSGATHPR